MTLLHSVLRALATPEGQVLMERGAALLEELLLRRELRSLQAALLQADKEQLRDALESQRSVTRRLEKRLHLLESAERQRAHSARASRAQLKQAQQLHAEALQLLRVVQDAWEACAAQAALEEVLNDAPQELEEDEDDLEPSGGDDLH